MKPYKRIACVVTAAVTSLMITYYAAAKGGTGGTSILHWMLSTEMSATGVESNATGSVGAKLVQQGAADNQQLVISVAGLQSNTTYDFQAVLLGDTNLTEVTSFTTDTNGAATLDYVHVGSSRGRGSPHGTPLPDVINPISDIRELDIVQTAVVVLITNQQTVLTADLTDPDTLQYLVKRSLTNDGVETGAAASLRIKATANATQFRLTATGLTPTSPYFLAINGSAAESVMTDASGGFRLMALPTNAPPQVLDITSLAIWNSSSNSVLHTDLP